MIRFSSLICIILFFITVFMPITAEGADVPLKLTPMPVNTEFDEDDPLLVPSLNTLYPARFYFSRKNEKGKYSIYYSKFLKKTNKWSTPETIGAYVETESDDRSCFLTEEGKFPQTIIYATKKDKLNNNFDLFRSFRDQPGKDMEDRAFNPGKPLLALDTETDEMHPWLTKDQLTLYFSRKTKDGWQQMVAKRVKGSGTEGNFDAPEPLKDIPVGFHHATINPLGNLMFLEGISDDGRLEIFSCTKTLTGGWSKPVSVSNLKDSTGKIGAKSPSLSRDGLKLYFASDRAGGQGGLDIYSATVSELKLK
ncbi:MAG: hypothetical protein EBQ87_05915 [Planctomycetes bacterium]|nr:hypothetical protein [Planctomycetota bacterium]